MPITTAADHESSPLGAAMRLAGLLLLGAAATLAFAFAAVAALVIGLMVMGAALALRFDRPLKRARPGQVLEARRTPSGWVVEANARQR